MYSNNIYFIFNFFFKISESRRSKIYKKKFNLFKIQAQLRFNLEPSIIYM